MNSAIDGCSRGNGTRKKRLSPLDDGNHVNRYTKYIALQKRIPSDALSHLGLVIKRTADKRFLRVENNVGRKLSRRWYQMVDNVAKRWTRSTVGKVSSIRRGVNFLAGCNAASKQRDAETMTR